MFRRRHLTSADRSVVEDYDDAYQPPHSDKPDKDPEYWRVNLPSDDLDRLMWGGAGVPPSTAPPDAPPGDGKDQAADDEEGAGSENENGESSKEDVGGGEESLGEADGVHDNSDENECENGDVLSALEISDAQDQQKEPSPAPAPDKIILEDIVWKQRSGFGKYSFGIMQHEWEQRRVVLFESGTLRYYALRRNMEGVRYDPEHATDPRKSPWAYDPRQEPRGEMSLRGDREDENPDDGEQQSLSSSDHRRGTMRRLHSLVSSDKSSGNDGGVKVQARERQSDPGPTPYEIDITRRDNNLMWRFCFQSQSIQIEWLSTLKSIASDDGDTSDDDSIDGPSEGLANHGFQPGDHIIRWEMLPILYPVQIHGIVLEAGKNCVIVADFGLASYDNRSAGSDDLNTFEEKDDSHDIIMAAWEKIKPKTKRLNVAVITDRREIRKWSKINYSDRKEKEDKKGGKKKKGFFKSLIPWEQKNGKKGNATEEDGAEMGEGEEREAGGDCVASDDGDADEAISAVEENGSPVKQIELTKNNDADGDHAEELNAVEGEPEWAQPGYRPRKRTASSSSSATAGDGQSVFSIERLGDVPTKSELPKSDSAKLVLARTHFILENEDLLPPYHVFYSNSECIAVWCKTGRWSTLQAAVYLVSSSVGFGKSAAMMTLSVAAAHVILVPALAVGGLAVVGAPLVWLKKSQEKWDKATMRLTDEFWRRASPDVFVEAIEYWANWGGGGGKS